MLSFDKRSRNGLSAAVLPPRNIVEHSDFHVMFSCDDAQAEMAICSISYDLFYWSLFQFSSAFLLRNSNKQQVYQCQLVCEHHMRDMFFLSSTGTADH